MPGFLHRLGNLLRGKTDRLLSRMEKPEEQLAVFVAELGGQIQELQRSVVSAIADEKRLHKQMEGLVEKAGEWEARAVTALEQDDEALARSALEQQEDCHAQAATLCSSWEVQKQATAQLKDSLKLAKVRMEEARRRYNLLLAQYRSAQTKQRIQQTLSSATPESPMRIMEALEEKIRTLEAETEAQLELEPAGTAVDVEAQFLRIDQKRRGDEALARLRARLDARATQPGDGAAEGDPVAELKESLKR